MFKGRLIMTTRLIGRIRAWSAGLAVLSVVTATQAGTPTYRFTKLVDSTTPIPEGSGTFLSLNLATIDANGDIAFTASDSNSDYSVYAIRDGVLEKIANHSDVIPGTTEHYEGFQHPLIRNGETWWKGFKRFGLETHEVLVQSDGADATLLVDTNNTQVPGEPLGTTFEYINNRTDIKGDTLTFAAGWGDPENIEGGIFNLEGGVISPVVRFGDLAPNGDPFGRQMAVTGVDRQSDRIGFSSWTASGGYGIFVSNNGTLTKIVDQTTTIPGTTNVFEEVDDSGAIDGGWVTFLGLGSNGLGLYLHDGNQIQTIADTSTALSNGNTIESIGLYTLNNGMIAFTAYSNTTSELLLWRDGALHSVVKSGDLIDGQVVWYVGYIHVRGFTGNYLAANIGFTNGTEAIYRIEIDTCGPAGDLDCDGDVDLADYALFAQNFTGPM